MISECAAVLRGVRASGLLVFALAFLGLGRCGGYEPGIEVSMALRAAPSTLAFRTDMGFEVRLEEAVLWIDSLELLPCDTVARRLPSGIFFAIPRAFAHVDEEPTASKTVPLLDALHSGGLSVEAATLRPPPGRYCGLGVVLKDAAVDAEAVGLHLRGSARRDGSDHGFSVLTTASKQTAEVPFEEPLELSADRRTAALTLVVDQRRWLDGIDFETLPEEDQRSRVMQNVLGGFVTDARPSP